jgi:hypothetical protein
VCGFTRLRTHPSTSHIAEHWNVSDKTRAPSEQQLTLRLGVRTSSSINPQKVHGALPGHASCLPFASPSPHERPPHITHRRALPAKSRVYQWPCREIHDRRTNRRDACKRQRRRAHPEASSSKRTRAVECRDVRLFWSETDGCLLNWGSGCTVSAFPSTTCAWTRRCGERRRSLHVPHPLQT